MRARRLASLVAVTTAAAAAGVAVLRSCLIITTVVGLSMTPGLAPGDRVLVRRRARATLRVGSVVLLPEPGAAGPPRPRGLVTAHGAAALRRSWVVKRIAAMPGDAVPPAVRDAVGVGVVPPGMLVVLGDNSAQSADSRVWGFMPADDVLGVVVRSLS